ncbi:ABC transporter permease [Chelatococcus reniformis]|uniref:Putrescine ABC transporter permease PotI n=1 Tax=Chelatococcus reniformis TaxID=1494448 RepID=A0A916U4E6_9HYPH|nr:ABC transporter permease [Chelatococcus reniformis]GGC57131.1 putrescine ABC transporter permease PotI [Chelatococcus reniformis]
MHRGNAFRTVVLLLGLGFLYLPIVVLVIYSFNASRLVTVWGGFSIQWYVALFANAPLMEAAWTSLKIATLSASLATVLGTLAALALVRHGRFGGRSLFTGLIYAPLVMPEVIVGLALLLLFVSVGADRGLWTVVVAHTTLTLCFATVIIQARLASFDRALEEAAMDLGCPPAKTFFTITLPLIAPAVGAAFLLAFTLSLDDLVIASFTTGPGATTLPMRIYSQVRLGVTPEINAACTVLIAFVAVGLGLSFILTRSGARHRDEAAGEASADAVAERHAEVRS